MNTYDVKTWRIYTDNILTLKFDMIGQFTLISKLICHKVTLR